jgi:hypothetical protein
MGNRTNAELETIIRWDRDEKIAWLWTADIHVANKWRKRGYEVFDEPDDAWGARVPARCISFRPNKPSVRTAKPPTEAQKAAREEFAARARSRRESKYIETDSSYGR